MTLDELLASPSYQSAAPDDRMRHIDVWALQAKQEAPEEAAALDAEVPRLRAREYVTAALPSLNLDKDTATRYRDLYMKAAQRPHDSNEPEDWRKFDEEYLQKDRELAAMAPEERLKFAQFNEVMERAGKHFQTAEEAKNGERESELDYGNGVKIPIKTKTLHDRKQVTITYPDGTPETFEYALDEPPPNAERLRQFMVQNRPEHLGEWSGDFTPIRNLAAHAGNAMVDMGASGVQFADALTGEADAAMFGGKGKRDAAITIPLFVEKQTGPDGADRWVKRPKPAFLTDITDEEFADLQNTALQIAKGKVVPDEAIDRFYTHPELSKVLDDMQPRKVQSDLMAGEGANVYGDPNALMDKLVEEQTTAKVPEEWAAATEKERREIGARLAQMELAKSRGTREGLRPFNVDPSNLLINQEDKKSTDGTWWGAQTLDWLGDKAFNIPTVGQAVGSSLPTLAGGLAAGPAGVAPFAALMGLSEGNQAYEDVMKRNLDAGVDAETARQRAMGAGAAYAALATVLEQAGGVFETGVFQGTIGKSRTGRLLLGFAPESTEETAQSIAQDLISNAAVPDEAKKKASQIVTDALEAGAGALSFGVIPGAGGALKPNVKETPLTEAAAEVIQDPEVPTEAKQAVAEAADLDARATALKEAAQAAAAQPKTKEEPAAAEEPETPEAPADQEKQAERSAAPLAYADEAGDAFYGDGAWVLPDGTPAPNAAELETKRQEYIRTGDMPEGMQPLAPPEKPETTQTDALTQQSATTVDGEPSGTGGSGISGTEGVARSRQAPEEEAPRAPAPEEEKPVETPEPAPAVRTAPDEAAPGEVLEEPVIPGAEAPAKQVRGRTGRKLTPTEETMRTREFKSHPTVENDFISQIIHAMGGFFGGPTIETIKEKGQKPKLKLADKHKGEWNWYSHLLEDPDSRNVLDRLFIDNAASLDDVAKHFGLTNAEVGEKVADAARERVRVANEMRAGGNLTPEERGMEAGEQQTKAFEKATKKAPGKEPVTTWDLNAGDQLEIDGTPVRVIGMTEDGDAILRDGTRFGEQILPTGEAIWVEKETLPKFSAVQQELDFNSPLEDVVFKLDASARVPGITAPELEKEVTRLAGNRIPELAQALGYKPNAKDIAQQLIAENKGATAKKRADEATPEETKAPRVEGEGLQERALTPEEKAARRKGESDEAPEGTRPEDFEDETPQPNPFSLPRFSASAVTPQQDAAYMQAVESGDMKTAQAMVDAAAKAAGYTVKAFHGTNADFSEFDPKRQSLDAGYYGRGVYFDATPRTAEHYAASAAIRNGGSPKIVEAFLKLRNPVRGENTTGMSPEEVSKWTDKKIAAGHDGVVGSFGQEFVVFDPSQIKSADPITRDASGNVIPLSQRFNPESSDIRFSTPAGKVISRGATTADVDTAKKSLSKLLPNVSTAWTGTRKELEKHLASDAKFRWKWKRAWRAVHPGASEAQANEAFTSMLEHGLDNKEGFTFAKRTYLISDQVAVRESDKTPANAVRRVLIHEDAHEGLRHLRDADQNVEEQWQKFRDAIPAEELDALAQSKYPGLADWRTKADQHDEIADEWFAAKVADAERRGMPTDGLISKFVQWLKGLMQRLAGDNLTITDKALIEFMDAARFARFRDRAEANTQGIRFSSTNSDGDMPPKRMMDLMQNEKEDGSKVKAPMRTRYNLMDQEQKDAFDKWVDALPDDMKELTQFLGNPNGYKHIRQSLPLMLSQARATLGGVNGEVPAVTPENTEKAREVMKRLLNKETFAAEYKKEFQDLWSPKDGGRILHKGDATAAVLQMELMDYAVRAKDIPMMSRLLPVANDTILGDFQSATRSGAGRILQVASMAARSNGIWTALRQLDDALENAAIEALGGTVIPGEKGKPGTNKSIRQQLEILKGAVDTSINDDLKDEVDSDIDGKVQDADGLAELVKSSTSEEYETEGYWQRVLNTYAGEERADLYAFWQSLIKLDRLIQLEQSLEAEAGSQLKASKADDIAAFKANPEKLKQAIAEEKKRLLELLGKVTKDDASSESKESRRKMTRDKRVKRAVKALSETAQAKKMIERFESRNKRLKRDKPAWRKTFEEQVKSPKGKDEFVQAMIANGVTEQTSNRLFDVAAELNTERAARKTQDVQATYDKKVTGDYKAPVKGPEKPKLTDTKAFISSVARQITGASIREQEDPTWKRQTIINAFLERGMSQAAAEQAADKLTGIIDRALREGQAKAAIAALSTLKKGKKIDAKKIGEAIRTRGLDPLNPNPVIAALAKEAGYEALTPEQFKRLAELDEQINSAGPHLAAKAYSQMDAILHKVRPRKRTRDIITGSWVYSALSSLGVWALNWIHPIYIALNRLGVDMASIGSDVATMKTKPTDVPRVFTQYLIHWANAMGGFAAEAAFALKNDAYSNKVLEMFQSPHRMHQEMLDAAEKIRTGTPTEKVTNVFKWLATSTDYMRRIMASADQSWGGVLQQYIIQNESMRQLMHKAGLSAEAAATVINAAVTEGQGAMAKHIATGAPAAESILVGKDAMQAALKKSVADLVGTEEAEEVELMGQKEPAMEIGNRRPESGGWFDIVNGVLEGLKVASTAILNRLGLSGRMIVGFPSVGANILNRSAYFTPLGTMRAIHKMYLAKDPESLYAETMATEGQARMRLIESIIGTLGFTLLAMLMRKKPDEEGLHFSGDGPSNKTLRDAWMKAGHKPGHIEWVGEDGTVKASISYTRGGLNNMALPLTFLGALDDMRLDGKKAQKKNANFAWSYAETALHGVANQARFFGMKNLVSSFPTSTKDTSIAGNIAYTAAPFIPWSGLTKSMTKILTGEQDKTSWDAAFLAQLPIVPAFTGQPALNALGDQVGPQSIDLTTKVSERLEYSGAPLFIGVDTKSRNADVYRFMLKKGVAPAMPMRSTIEADNGFITDKQWARYVKLRGSYLKDGIREKKDTMQFMSKEDAGNEMETISREATKRAKSELSLK